MRKRKDKDIVNNVNAKLYTPLEMALKIYLMRNGEDIMRNGEDTMRNGD